MEKVHVVTHIPPYDDQRSVKKAFKQEEDAEKFIEEEKDRMRKMLGNNAFLGDWDIDEVDLI